jgi:hypothetical protein
MIELVLRRKLSGQLDGVLGGFANITDLDLEGSKRFIRDLKL